MACTKLGSKSEVFHLDGQIWLCSTGLPSDVVVEVGDMSFHLHKFPLLSRSRVLENLIGDLPGEDEKKCVLQLHDIPGGAKSFLLVAKFCYGVRIELTALNVVSLRCAAEYLQMNEDYGEGNLVTQTESFLNEVFGNWADTIKALETCEEVLPHAEELHIVSRCINSLAMKACADLSLFSWPMSGLSATQSPVGSVLWNGIRTAAKPLPMSEDWWYEDVSFLRLPLYKRLILAVGSRGLKPERISGSLMFYAKKYLPLRGRQSSFQNGNRAAPGSNLSAPYDADQRTLLEEIVELLPDQKGVTPTKLLLRLLRTSMILHASPSCRENLEKRVGAQMDEAVLEDLLIPNMGYSMETLYDVDCFQRILDHFMLVDRDATDSTSSCIIDEGQLQEGSHSLTPMTMVASLVDGYLAEVAPDVNLKLPKFQSLAAVIPDYARPLYDGIYRAIDIYLKKTIANCIQRTGKALHSNKVTTVKIWPEFAGEGRYIDFHSKFICASIDFAEETPLCTTLCKDGHIVRNVEHLLSALEATSVDNCRIEISNLDCEDRSVKAHPWLIDSEREQLCRLMNCQKLSLEASTHAAQNERLPLRVIVQVLFFEQLRLRTSIASWFFVSDNLENSQNPSGNFALPRNDHSNQAGSTEDHIVGADDMRERVFELEKECLNMRQEMEKLVKTKGSWNNFCRRFGLGLKLKSCDPKASKLSCNSKVPPPSTPPLLKGKQSHVND